jgi:hypothetical protein
MQARFTPNNIYSFCLSHAGKRFDKHFSRHVLSFRIAGPHTVSTSEVALSGKDKLDHVHLPFLTGFLLPKTLFEINYHGLRRW